MEAELSGKGADMAMGWIVQANQVFLVEQVIWFAEINKVSMSPIKQEDGFLGRIWSSLSYSPCLESKEVTLILLFYCSMFAARSD